MSNRLRSGVKSTLTDPNFRRTTTARLKWLVRGSGKLQAWSYEYRAGLTGRFHVNATRSAEQREQIVHCPSTCGANAPLSHLYERRFTYRLRDTVVNSNSSATIMWGTPEPPFFIRESISWPFESILSHGLNVPETKSARALEFENADEPAIVFPSTPNYYHWLIEELPLILRAHQEFPNANYLVFDEQISDKHQTVAHYLGITLQAVPLTIQLADQVLPGRANDSWFIHPQDAQALFHLGKGLTKSEPRHSEKIYISRRFSSRSLENEEDIEGELAQDGFQIVHLENMPWLNQIQTFQNAEVVVAPHGAGLANLVFTKPGAQLVELTNGYHYNRCFEWICHVQGHDYRKVDADAQQLSTTKLIQEISSQLH